LKELVVTMVTTHSFEHLVQGLPHHLRSWVIGLVHAIAETHESERIALVLGALDVFRMRATVPISFNISSTASVAPPCTGPHRQAIPAEMQAYGFAPDDPARRTVAVDALCSWSA